VQDGHFVPNLTIGAPVVQSLRKHSKAFFDCHLMVTNPQQWIQVTAHQHTSTANNSGRSSRARQPLTALFSAPLACIEAPWLALA
jgi:hypothetical protein